MSDDAISCESSAQELWLVHLAAKSVTQGAIAITTHRRLLNPFVGFVQSVFIASGCRSASVGSFCCYRSVLRLLVLMGLFQRPVEVVETHVASSATTG